jgi:hypothetical protein
MGHRSRPVRSLAVVDPDDPARTWTLAEANAALGRVSETVARAMQATDRQTLVDAAEALAAEGVLLRDHRTGLIDFAARARSGRPYWLCWMWGEPDIDTWHWVEDGFAGRTPVSELPR